MRAEHSTQGDPAIGVGPIFGAIQAYTDHAIGGDDEAGFLEGLSDRTFNDCLAYFEVACGLIEDHLQRPLVALFHH
jgi:hypothetical protein